MSYTLNTQDYQNFTQNYAKSLFKKNLKNLLYQKKKKQLLKTVRNKLIWCICLFFVWFLNRIF